MSTWQELAPLSQNAVTMMINYPAATCLLLSAAVLLSDHQLFVKSIGAVNIRGGAAIDDRIAKNNHIFDLHNGRRIQLNSCNCISKINSDCHTIPECQASSDACINPKGKNKCNESGNYIWQAQSTPPPTPAPAPTQPPAPSSSCSKCVVDSSKPCSAPTECPLLSSPGTCSAPSPQPTNGMECTQDSQCKPITGNPSSRGSCSGVFTTNTVCDTTLTCPPTPSPVTQTLPPTSPPTSNPTDAVTPPPTPSPTAPPSPQPTPNPTEPIQTYCGCPECTSTIWNAQACRADLDGCYTCGSRIDYLKGLGQTEAQACTTVSDQFSDGPCGPVCNPNVCNGTPEPTHIPTKVPTAPPSPDPSTNPPTQQFFCGCPECTSTIWNAQACRADLGGCYTCGSRIDYLKGLGQTEVQACTTVSNQFSNGPCGPVCNPSVCNELVLDEPDPNKLTWSDEFNVDGAPDSTKWDYDLGDGCDKGICGWGNNELQVYTASPNNVLVGNGVLRISAKKANGEYTSTRMVSRGKKAFRYGRIRLRARLAGCTAKGTWPALWMLPESWVYGGWPNSGEIDIMEAVGYEENMFHGSVHTSAYNHAIGTQKTGSVSKPEADWHVFEIDWQADKIRFAVDNQVYFVFAPDDISDSTKWPFNQDFHLLLNIAVGGNWGGLNGVDAPAFEDADGQYIEVDWVRAYSS